MISYPSAIHFTRVMLRIVCLLLLLLCSLEEGAVVFEKSRLGYGPQFDASYGCSVDGKTIKHGENFTTKASGPCITYKCQNRAFIPINIRCQTYGDKCVDIGQNITSGTCLVQQCKRMGQSIGFAIVQEGCPKPGGKRECIGVNKPYKDGCTTYTCLKEGGSYHTEVTDWGCKYGGRCIKSNGTIISPCTVQRCEKRGIVVGLVSTDTGCLLPNGNCMKPGDVELEHCLLYKCQTDILNGRPWKYSRQVGAMCEDYRGACHNDGGSMQVLIGSTLKDCTCVINGLSAEYRCT